MSEAQTIKSTFIPKPPPDASFLEIESAAAASATLVGNQIDMATVTSSQMELNSQTLDPYPNHLENNPEEEENDYWKKENKMLAKLIKSRNRPFVHKLEENQFVTNERSQLKADAALAALDRPTALNFDREPAAPSPTLNEANRAFLDQSELTTTKQNLNFGGTTAENQVNGTSNKKLETVEAEENMEAEEIMGAVKDDNCDLEHDFEVISEAEGVFPSRLDIEKVHKLLDSMELEDDEEGNA